MEGNILSIISITLAVFRLFLHLKNRNTMLRSFEINRANYRSSNIDLIYINAIKENNNLIIKLALFNPGPVAAIIKSLTVYKKVANNSFPSNIIRLSKWDNVSSAKWWPTENTECKEIKCISQEYHNLYVDQQRDILVAIPDEDISRSVYKFVIKTNLGGYVCNSSTDAVKRYFSHDFKQFFLDNKV